MQPQKIIQNHDEFPYTHHFIYSNKKFPIKIDLFKNSSEIFAQNQIDINENKIIQLVDDNLAETFTLSDESIQNFIKYVHRQDTILNNDNVIGVNYLAKKYKVNSLTKATEEYINDHHHEILIPIFLINQNNSTFDTSAFENILSENLDQYIDDDRLLNFEIPVLYRVLEKYSKSGKCQNGLNQNVVEFLFKCLDKHKRKASVLFTFIGIEKIQSEYLQRLLTKYSEVFDFHFINSSLAKNLYEIQNEMIVKDQQSQMQQKEFMKSVTDQLLQMRDELGKMKNLNDKLIDDQKQKDEQHSSEISTMKNEIENLKLNNNKLIAELKQKEEEHSSDIKTMKNEMENLKLNNNKLIAELKSKEEEHSSDIKTIKNEIEKLKMTVLHEQETVKKEEAKRYINIPYSGQNYNGVINYLKQKSNINDEINITSSSKWIGELCNLLEIEGNDYFYTENRQDSWICIEFKKYKIIPTSYMLKSHDNEPGGCQPKNWVIEGSIDNEHWNKIDEQKNCSYLNGRFKLHMFTINYKESVKEFKFIRIRQTGLNCNSNNSSYNLTLCCIEFYGSLI